MAGERPQLTGEQIAQAEGRIGFSHPVLAVIDQHAPTVARLTETYSRIADNQEQQRFIREHYGFLADALVTAGPYPLEATDLVAIWSRSTEVFSGYHRHAFAEMISSAYAIQGLESTGWRRFPRTYFETNELPSGVSTDREGLLHVRRRLDEIRKSLDELHSYVYGTNDSPTDTIARLGIQVSQGDPAAQAELKNLIASQKERQTSLLDELQENIRQGFTPLYFPIDDALTALGEAR